MKRFSLIFLVLCVAQAGMSQVTFDVVPRSRQLFPRDQSDSATVQISGQITQSGKSSVVYRLFRAGILLDSSLVNLSYNGNTAAFHKSFRIKAERQEYKVQMCLFDGQNEFPVASVDSLVAGDVFIVNGQSNASSPSQGPGAEIPNEWIRTFGTASVSAVDCGRDTLWGLGLGNVTQANLAVGVWAMKLGRLLTDSLQIPVCIINGAKFGSIISAHLPNANNHQDLNTIYGRLLFRATKAGVKDNIKAFFWYQGESNTDTSYQFYASRFQQLYNFWKGDFAGLNRIFVLQTRPGCITGANYLYHQQMREICRNLSNQYSDITLMSTAGIPNFDGCHFLSSGYNILGTHLYYLVQRDVYNATVPQNIDPPNILSARFVDSTNTLLALKMSQAVVWPAPMNGNELEDYFYFPQSGVNAQSGWASDDTVYLQLCSPSLVGHVSYLPGIYYDGSATQVYQGPWLLNNRNIGAFSFHEFPISHSINVSASGSTSLCNGDSVLLQADKNALILQWYRNGQPVPGANASELWASAGGDYYLEMSDGSGGSVISNVIQLSAGSSIPVSISTNDSVLCAGESSMLLAQGGTSWLWSDGSSAAGIQVNTGGWYAVQASDSLGCSSSDSIYIEYHPMPQASLLHGPLSVCMGDSVKLYLANQEMGTWTGGAYDSVYYAKTSGMYWSVVTGQGGCSLSSDTVYVQIIQTPVSILPTGPLSVCANQKITLTADGSGFTAFQWKNNGVAVSGATTNTYKPSVSGGYSVQITDSLGCMNESAITQLTMRNAPQASYTLTNELNECRDTLVTFTANGGSGLTYQWYGNNVLIPGATSKVFNTQTSGNYKVMTTNVWGCTKMSGAMSIPVANPAASIQLSGSNVICNGDSVRLDANTGTGFSYQWQRNNVPIAGANNASFYAKKTGFYKVVVTNSSGCSAVSSGKNISVSACLLSSGAAKVAGPETETLNIDLYPNPAVHDFTVSLPFQHGRVTWRLMDISGRICHEGQIEAETAAFSVVTEDMNAGLYLLHLEADGYVQTLKIQVSR